MYHTWSVCFLPAFVSEQRIKINYPKFLFCGLFSMNVLCISALVRALNHVIENVYFTELTENTLSLKGQTSLKG